MRAAMTAEEQRFLLDTAVSLPDLFRAVAAARGAAPALRGCPRTLSYRELDDLTDRIAARLAVEGVRPGDRVGILLPRSAETQISILAVLKAGAAYVPLDPSYPAERLRFLVRDAEIRVVLGDPEHIAARGLTDLRVLAPEADDTTPPAPPVPLDGSELAYVIYTSGSTGAPKGCMVRHTSVLELVRGVMSVVDLDTEDRVALFLPFIFDGSVLQFWLSLAAGATAVVVPLSVAQSMPDFLDLLRREAVTLVIQVPTTLRALAHAHEEAGRPPLALRYVLVGGESVELDVVSAFLARCPGTPPEVVNIYGPTEATCVATCRVLTQEDFDGPVRSPIGTALPHLLVEVRDEAMEPVPDGEIGELVIAGSGVAVGYLGRPELTAERFVVLDTPQGPVRYYRTGDLARRLPDGAFAYLGRNDQQVKVRGIRVELGEVETYLRAHPLVKDAAATVVDTQAGAQFLTACVVLVEDAPEKPEAVLRQHMLASLPPFAVPDRYRFVAALPSTDSGKLDRRALRDLAAARRASHP